MEHRRRFSNINVIFSAEAATCRDCALALMVDPPFSVVRPTCIHLLEDLLECTPLLPYCIIHGLNDLDWAAGAEACAEVLDVILRHRERADSVFNILLTTAGQSKTLRAVYRLSSVCMLVMRYGVWKGEARGWIWWLLKP